MKILNLLAAVLATVVIFYFQQYVDKFIFVIIGVPCLILILNGELLKEGLIWETGLSAIGVSLVVNFLLIAVWDQNVPLKLFGISCLISFFIPVFATSFHEFLMEGEPVGRREYGSRDKTEIDYGTLTSGHIFGASSSPTRPYAKKEDN